MEPKYVVETELDFEEFKRYAKIAQGNRTKTYLLYGALFVWILYAAVKYIRNGRTGMGIFMILVIVISPVIWYWSAQSQLKRLFKEMQDRGGAKYSLLFFDDHLDTVSENNRGTFDYRKLYGIIETPTNFYIEMSPGEGLIVQKSKCSDEITAYLQELKTELNAKRK